MLTTVGQPQGEDPPCWVAGVPDQMSVWHDSAANAFVGSVLDNDLGSGCGAPLSATLDTDVSHGALQFNTDGTFTYTPDSAFVGSDSFAYSVTDTLSTDTSTVSISVNNDAPVALDDGGPGGYSVGNLLPAGETGSNSDFVLATPGLLANDADADSLTVALIRAPLYGTLELNNDGSFSYDPDAGFIGSDEFHYSISDGIATDNAVVTFEVTGSAFTNQVTLTEAESSGALHVATLQIPSDATVSANSFQLDSLASDGTIDVYVDAIGGQLNHHVMQDYFTNDAGAGKCRQRVTPPSASTACSPCRKSCCQIPGSCPQA